MDGLRWRHRFPAFCLRSPLHMTPHIVSLSSLTERKGMPMLVEACRILRDRGVPFTCTIAGDGPQRALLEQKIGDYELENAPEDLALDGSKIAVSDAQRTSHPKVWAGGDCAAGGDDLTVTAVAEGRDAAEDIHKALMGAA